MILSDSILGNPIMTPVLVQFAKKILNRVTNPIRYLNHFPVISRHSRQAKLSPLTGPKLIEATFRDREASMPPAGTSFG